MSQRTARLTVAGIVVIVLSCGPVFAQRQMENLGRGVVAINQGGGKVFVSWRMLGTEPDGIAFNLYRTVGNGQPARLNDQPIKDCTNFTDTTAPLTEPTSYS